MMKYLIGLVMLAIIVSSVGCGHHKGEVPTSLRRGEKTRALAVGDKGVYDLAVSWVNPSGRTVDAKDGAVTIEIKEGFKHGAIPANMPKTYHSDEQLDVQGSPSGQINWMGQDPEGAIYFLGRLDEGTEWSLVKDKDIKPDTPAVLQDGLSWSYTSHLSGGKTETTSYKITGMEKVMTPAGDFEAYKTQTETKISDGTLVRGTIWLRPEFPRGVKMIEDVTNAKSPKRIKTHIEEALKSYKLAE